MLMLLLSMSPSWCSEMMVIMMVKHMLDIVNSLRIHHQQSNGNIDFLQLGNSSLSDLKTGENFRKISTRVFVCLEYSGPLVLSRRDDQ